MGKIAILSAGLWRLRSEVAAMTGLDPVRGWKRLAPSGIEAVAGWGHKPTAGEARRMAARRGIAYFALEDGFLRSVRPGGIEPPSALVLDRTGIYYDARGPSDLESLINASEGDLSQADGRAIIDFLRTHRLSKYNAAPWKRTDTPLKAGTRRRVLVIDQTFADASIAGGLADEKTFHAMLSAAVAENPGAEVAVRLHPEVISGAKRGYLADLARRENLSVLSTPLNPWRLFEDISRVYTVSSQLGLEALMAGCSVTCFGVPFYAGWGLTDDRQAIARRGRKACLPEIVAAAYGAYSHYFDAWTRAPVDFFTAADQVRFLATHFHGHSRPVIGWRVPRWKRHAVSRMLDGAAGPVAYERQARRAVLAAKARGGAVAAWGKRADLIRPLAAGEGVDVITIEDGFLRSVGLGAGFTPALSYVFDSTGIYYDPSRASDIETLLAESSFDAGLLERARRLIDLVRDGGVTKYNLRAHAALPAMPDDRQIVLVPGQVADDELIRRGAPDLFAARPLAEGGANLELLERVRQRHPGAYIVYRPHPDVEAGYRAGRIGADNLKRLADCIDPGYPLEALLSRVDRIETATSLLGFEALLRGRPVTVHGCPFYAGWGLTEDLTATMRRYRRRSLQELTAATLILYPVYLDAASDRVCSVENMARQLVEAQKLPDSLLRSLRRGTGAALGRLRGVAQMAQILKKRR